jgi:hypothetical protein
VRRLPGGTLAVAFVLDADAGRLCIPPPRAPSLVHGLWQHTCFEAFIALDKTPAYHEFNFSPSGEWMVYAFQRYREFASQPEMPAPETAVRRATGRLELDATLRLDHLSAGHTVAPMRLGLAAVVEAENGALSYWALRHPPGEPDFHHSDAFALTITRKGATPT